MDPGKGAGRWVEIRELCNVACGASAKITDPVICTVCPAIFTVSQTPQQPHLKTPKTYTENSIFHFKNTMRSASTFNFIFLR
jgi:hypothetical protein